MSSDHDADAGPPDRGAGGNADPSDAAAALGSLGSISEGAGLFLVGRGVSRGIGLLTNVILTRGLGPGLYGIFAYINVVFSLIYVFTRLGADKAVLRFVPQYEDAPRTRAAVLTLAYGTTLAASAAVAVLVYAFAPLISAYTLEEPLFVDVLRITAIVIPFNTLATIVFAAFKAVERMDYNVAVSSVAKPVYRLAFIGGAVLLGFSLVGAAAGFVVSGVLTLATAVWVLADRTDLDDLARPSRATAAEYYDFSLPLTLNQLGSFLYNRVDILMVGILLTGPAVGVYNVAVMVSRLLGLPVTAFNQLFPPIASRLYGAGERAELEAVYATVTRWIFTVSLFPGVAVLLYAEEVLRVFGEGFTEGAVVLMLFVLAQLANSAVGPSGFLLMMTDHQYLVLLNQLGSGLVNVALNYLLILEFGFVGAAMATATVLAAVNVLRLLEVWYYEGLVPYGRSYLKPLAAGGVAAAVMAAVSMALDRYALLVVGGALGGVAFLATLYALGLEPEDAVLLEGVLPEDGRLRRLLL